MTITIIIICIASLFLLNMRRKHWKQKSEFYFNKACHFAYLWSEETNKNNEWKAWITKDQRKLSMSCERDNNAIRVIATCPTDSEVYFVIKTFPYNPDDPGDMDFAAREAEELIDKIDEA